MHPGSWRPVGFENLMPANDDGLKERGEKTGLLVSCVAVCGVILAGVLVRYDDVQKENVSVINYLSTMDQLT